MRRFEITNTDTGETVRWTLREAKTFFGSKEWPEILAGYLPQYVAVEITGDTPLC